jgi:hypothetical protein
MIVPTQQLLGLKSLAFEKFYDCIRFVLHNFDAAFVFK